MTTKVRLYILALAGTALLTPIGVEARDVSRSALQFGDISYSEVVSSRSGDEPAFVGVPDTDVALSLDIPVPVGTLMIRDSAISLTLGLAGKRCRVFTGIHGYRDLSIGEIGRRLVQLGSGCDWSDAAIANDGRHRKQNREFAERARPYEAASNCITGQ
jgi:hypothetical protein